MLAYLANNASSRNLSWDLPPEHLHVTSPRGCLATLKHNGKVAMVNALRKSTTLMTVTTQNLHSVMSTIL